MRYDGIYRIAACWRKPGNQGPLVCRYLFVRADNEPAPWSTEGAPCSAHPVLRTCRCHSSRSACPLLCCMCTGYRSPLHPLPRLMAHGSSACMHSADASKRKKSAAAQAQAACVVYVQILGTGQRTTCQRRRRRR